MQILSESPNLDPLAQFTFILAFATIILALATIALARENRRLSKDSSKNIEISKNNLMEHHLVREMECIVGPLYDKKDHFQHIEYVHCAYMYRPECDPNDIWRQVEKNKYLVNSDLRDSITIYLESVRELNRKLPKIGFEIYKALLNEKKNHPESFGYNDSFVSNIQSEFSGLPTDKDARMKRVNELIDGLRPESEARRYLDEYRDILGASNLELMRSDLRSKVIDRYKKLEEKIDKIRESLEKN